MERMEKMTVLLAIEFDAEIKQAIKRFGRYSFNDKGPHEVMDVESCARRLRALPALDALSVLKDLAKSQDGCALVSSLLGLIEDWDGLFQLDEEFISEYY